MYFVNVPTRPGPAGRADLNHVGKRPSSCYLPAKALYLMTVSLKVNVAAINEFVMFG